MRRTVLFVLMIPLLLTGCTARWDREKSDLWRESVRAAEEISFDAEITLTAAETASVFSVSVRCASGETELTVTAPEILRGIVCRSKNGERSLCYDGMILYLPGEAETVSPCLAPSLLLEAIRVGRLLYTGRADSYRTAAFELGSGECVTLWLTEENVPVYAEISREGQKELTLRLDRWQTKEKTRS